MDGVIENVYVIDGHDSINSHTLYQQNVCKPLIISNNGDDIEINDGLKNFLFESFNWFNKQPQSLLV